MKKHRSDKPLTIALCVSLTLHTALFVLLIHEKIELLIRELTPPVLADSRKLPVEEVSKENPPPEEPPQPLLQPDVKPIEVISPKPPPPQPPQKPKKPSDQNEENIEWGEKNGKGIAITSAPGQTPLSARKGMEDQSAASRDPEGPEAFPDEPSMSMVPPGENGDGRKPVKDPLAGKGTEGNPAQNLGHPEAASVPPAPLPDHTAVAAANDSQVHSQASGKSVSLMPVPEKSSPAEPNQPTERDGPTNDPAIANAEPILPIKQPDVIGISSNEPAYPDVVPALIRPPGSKLSAEPSELLASNVLPNLVAADIPTAPQIQPATAALQIKPQMLEEMARKLGETDPRSGPVLTDALIHAPGEIPHEGGDAPLPELAAADHPEGSEILDAIAHIVPPEPRPEEMAEVPVPTAQTPPATAEKPTPAGQVASATGGVPGAPVSAADPAPDTGFESDPFAKIPGVDFHDGKVEARSGRQVKPIRPRLSEAGRRDLLAMQFPTVIFKVRIDKTGKVKDVSVIQGSGSEAIDMPVYRALWEWWFEPPRDKKGNPLEDVQLVSIHWG